MIRALLHVIAVLCLIVALCAHSPARAQGGMLEIYMDELVDDKWSGRVEARGNVEIRYYGEILQADVIAYDRRTGKLTAEGNVALTDVNGKTRRGDHLVLNDELRDAFVAYARRQKIRFKR